LEEKVVIAERLKALRELKSMSQGDFERRTGLLRCYISRVENGHMVPAIETLEKLTRAMEVSMYQLFHDGEKPPAPPIPMPKVDQGWDGSGHDAKTLVKFRRLIRRTEESDLKLLLFMAQKMSQKKKRGSRA
jgi:transcriptional regulator with XRE-family HTH domain